MINEPGIQEPPRPVLLAFVSLVGLVMLAIVLSAPPNLVQNNEDRMAAYVRDIVENGHWICQRDGMGRIASKPPLYAWISSLATLCTGEINRISLYFPSILSTLLLGGIIFTAGRARLGWLAGVLGAFAYLLSHAAEKQMVMARYDGLLALTVTLAALAAFRAWTVGGGWMWFWLAAAAGTLTKGPLGLVLPAGGLLAAWWEKRTTGPAPIRGSHTAGIALFLVISGGWFVLAYGKMGQELISKMIFSELFSHAVVADDGALAGSGFFKPLLVFLSDFAPWSVFTCLSLWQAWKRPAADMTERRFERFICCWFLTDLIVFSLAAHQRSRLILPLIPPAALLAGRELARLAAHWRPVALVRTITGATLIGLLAFGVYEHALRSKSKAVRKTQGFRQLALQVRAKVGDHFPLTHVNSPFVFQYYSRTLYDLVPVCRAAQLVRSDGAVFLVLEDVAALKKEFGPDAPSLHELARWPASGKPALQIFSNHPRLEWNERMAFGIGPIRIEMVGARLGCIRGDEFVFSSVSAMGRVKFTNDSDQAKKLRVRIIGQPGLKVHDRVLMPGESWQVGSGKGESERESR